jgi:hypothetical protein
VEERSSWLPPGLESSGLEPDDRAAQIGKRKRGKDSERPLRAWRPETPQPSEQPQPEAKASNGGGRRSWKREEEPEQQESQPQEPEQQEPQQPESQQQESPRGKWTREDQPREKPSQQDRPQERPRERGEKHGEQGAKQPAARERPRGDHQPSDVDAMGQDKHRTVIGQRYGASRGRQLLYYGIFIAFLVFSYIGLSAAVSHFDKKPAHSPDAAPWSKAGAPQGPLGGFEPAKAHQRGPTHFQ